MKRNVKPAANGIIGRILPGLEAIAMGEVMGRLPVVEGLVAVLDWGKQSSNHAGSEKEIERRDGLHGICARPSVTIRTCAAHHGEAKRTFSWRGWRRDVHKMRHLP